MSKVVSGLGPVVTVTSTDGLTRKLGVLSDFRRGISVINRGLIATRLRVGLSLVLVEVETSDGG